MTTPLLAGDEQLLQEPPPLGPSAIPLSDADFDAVVRADHPCGAENSGPRPCVPNKYLHARYYDPQLGIFLSPDRLHPKRPGVGTNRYSYALGSPVNGTDRSGREMRCGMTTSQMTEGSQEWKVYEDREGNPVMRELVYDDTKTVTVTSFNLDCSFFEDGPLAGFNFVQQERLLREDLFGGILDPEAPVIDPHPPAPTAPPGPPGPGNQPAAPPVAGPGSHVPDETWGSRAWAVAQPLLFPCKWACKPEVPRPLKPVLWVYMDFQVSTVGSALVIGAGNVILQVQATALEGAVLMPLRMVNPDLIGDKRLREDGAWRVFQDGYNPLWSEFVSPYP